MRSGGHSIESDISEENDARCGSYPGYTELAVISGVWREKRLPVGNCVGTMTEDVGSAEREKDDQYGNFDHDDQRIEIRRLLDSDYQNDGDEDDSKKSKEIERGGRGGQCGRIDVFNGQLLHNSGQSFPVSVIEDEFAPRRSGKRRANPNTQIAEQAQHVSAPTAGDGRGAEGIFQNQVPANDPRDEFA